jgi:hypothetical protein
MDWERSAIAAAAEYLRTMIDAGTADERAHSVYSGLVDVLDPARYATRVQRALASDAAAALVRAGLERRRPVPRRRRPDRRLVNVGPLDGERRVAHPRRMLADRRGC